MRFPIYEYLYQLNRNLFETGEILERIRKSPGMRKKPFKEHQVEIEHLRANATQDVLNVMNGIELDEAARFWRQKRAYEKSIRDPDDVYFDVREREEERRKQGLPSLIGSLHKHIREPEDEETDDELEKAASGISRQTQKVRQPQKSKHSPRKTKR